MSPRRKPLDISGPAPRPDDGPPIKPHVRLTDGVEPLLSRTDLARILTTSLRSLDRLVQRRQVAPTRPVSDRPPAQMAHRDDSRVDQSTIKQITTPRMVPGALEYHPHQSVWKAMRRWPRIRADHIYLSARMRDHGRIASLKLLSNQPKR
jgi:hypothetical protein